MTHSYAKLAVSAQAFKEVHDTLKAAGYGHTIVRDDFHDTFIDMSGIALEPRKGAVPSSGDEALKTNGTTRELYRLLKVATACVARDSKQIHRLRCLLREIDVAYVMNRAELPRKLHAKIVNIIGVTGK